MMTAPRGIDHPDRPEVLGGHGAVEQDEVADAVADPPDVRLGHPLGDCLQRKIIELEVAGNIGVDRGNEIGAILLCQDPLGAVHVPEHAGQDRAEGGRNGQACGEQQAHGHLLSAQLRAGMAPEPA